MFGAGGFGVNREANPVVTADAPPDMAVRRGGGSGVAGGRRTCRTMA